MPKFPKLIDSKYRHTKVKMLNSNLKEIIKDIYGKVKERDDISIVKIYPMRRKAIKINYKGDIVYAMILDDEAETICEENVYKFIKILKIFGINEHIINSMLLFHWSDLTYDNTGKVRYPIKYMYQKFPNKLANINKVFNSIQMQNKILNKYIFYDPKRTFHISYIIYKKDGIYKTISKEEASKKILAYKEDDDKIHVGPLQIHNKKRNIIRNKACETQRYYIKFIWRDYLKTFN